MSDINRATFTAPLSIAGSTPEGLQLRGAAHKRVWDRAVMFQLEVAPSARKANAFYRVEWRPFSPHTNSGSGPPELRFLVINGSHEHLLDDNCVESEDRLRAGNLGTARPLESEPGTYEALLEFVARQLNIHDMFRVPVPPWSGDLF